MKSIKRTLNLYLPFSKAGIKAELSYKAQIVMWIVISFVEVFFILFLYQAIYRNSANGMDSVINGFTFTEMVLYMITSFVYSFVMGAGETSYNIYTDIREGTIANTLTKPVSYRLRHLFTFLGMVALDMVIIMLPLMTITYGIFITHKIGTAKSKFPKFFVLYILCNKKHSKCSSWNKCRRKFDVL